MTALASLAAGAAVCGGFLLASGLALRRRNQPGAIAFAVLCLLFAVLTVVSAAGSVAGRSAIGSLDFLVFEFVVLAWLVLAVEYTGRGPAMTRGVLAGAVGFGLLVVAGVVLAPRAPSGWVPPLLAANYVLQSILFGIGGYGLLLVGRSVIGYDDLPAGGDLLLSTAAAGVVVLAFLRVAAEQVTTGVEFEITLGVLAVICLLFLVGLWRYRVFESGASTAHLARERVLEEMGDAVLITDREDRLLDCNPAFERTFGIDREATIGRPVPAVLAGPADAPAASELELGPDRDRIRLATTKGHREFALGHTVLTAGEESIGEAYLLRDVTDRRTREQRLDVLGRVMRHNLRNDLDAIHAFAETLEASDAQGSAGESAEIAARVRDLAADLADLGATIERGEWLLAREHLAYESVDVTAVADRLVDRYAEQYPGEGRVEASERPIQIRTDPDILEAVLAEVVENAFEHGPGEDARAVVGIEPTAAGATITVSDNGPGIPARERGVLLDGEETPLRHGSGVGLWLVHWGLTKLGGTLEFSENDPSGSVVRLRVPDRQQP